jgi:CRISPR-associated protein Csx10
MARIEIAILAESPISLGTTKAYGGTLIESATYVTGGQLRGALGTIKQHLSSTEQTEIDQLLGEPGIVFPNCYPTGNGPAYPLPLTAHSCKRAGGFKSSEEYVKRHGVADTLLRQLAYDRIVGTDGEWRIPLPFQYRCAECGNRTEPYSKFAERLSRKHYKQQEVNSHRQTRVAINRSRFSAEESQLYSVQAVDEGTIFIGETEVDERHAESLIKWVRRIKRVGGRTSSGFGRVDVKAGKGKSSQPIQDRVSQLNDMYRTLQSELRSIAYDPPAFDHRTLFTINLRSDAVLRNFEGLPTLQLEAQILREICTDILTKDRDSDYFEQLNIESVTQFTQPHYVSGWQTSWNLPKEVSLASRMGGVYVFAVECDNTQARDYLVRMLEKLEARGIGEMREDGYGQVAVCDGFHLEVIPV